MDFKDENGNSKRSRLDKVWEQTGKKPVDYKEPVVPEAGMDLFMAFWDLYKPDGITWEDFYYYGQYMDFWFNGDEIRIIKTLDGEVRKWLNKRQKAQGQKRPTKK